ncbi:hypothetical protein [Streptomyces sp. CAI-85]|uniref:hypothetical protein n=1 Tax=Streptomyces sp. CAI-85 TaxID=1472662 RepID=UPI001587562F|nr:hypothetical protein [Streptomyces sp. CAI-85]NUV65043.1 hypothetical protein [Streptomyces sp. CAI-85]
MTATEPRDNASRMDKWSVAWTFLALALWGLFSFLLLADHGPDALCRGPLVDPNPSAQACRDESLRQWPALLSILALTLLTTITAAATTVYAKLLNRLPRAEETERDGTESPTNA